MPSLGQRPALLAGQFRADNACDSACDSTAAKRLRAFYLLTQPLAGTPGKPMITLVSGSALAAAPHKANITFNKVYTAASYWIELTDVFRDQEPAITDSLTNVAHNEAGPWTRTLTVPAKGTYRFKVRWAEWGAELWCKSHGAGVTYI